MKLLADVNVLMALVWSNHVDHAKAREWWSGLGQNDGVATCAITELGFVRVSLQTSTAIDIAQLKACVADLRKAKPGHVFLTDTLGVDALPPWVKAAKQTTDGHLAALAEAHGATFVTFDAGIPGATVLK